MDINVSKTKIGTFSKGKVKRFPKFFAEQGRIGLVEDDVYLSVTKI